MKDFEEFDTLLLRDIFESISSMSKVMYWYGDAFVKVSRTKLLENQIVSAHSPETFYPLMNYMVFNIVTLILMNARQLYLPIRHFMMLFIVN
jgi:hypothetical protein